MKKLLSISVLFLSLLFITPDLLAGIVIPPGDVGSAECGAAQQACINAIRGVDFKNHGQQVRACAHASQSPDINDECFSCIVSQIARRIPLEELDACGTDVCLDCATGTPGNGSASPYCAFIEAQPACLDCINPGECSCLETTAGTCFCHNFVACDPVVVGTGCDNDAECPPGWACAFSCCSEFGFDGPYTAYCHPPCGTEINNLLQLGIPLGAGPTSGGN